MNRQSTIPPLLAFAHDDPAAAVDDFFDLPDSAFDLAPAPDFNPPGLEQATVLAFRPAPAATVAIDGIAADVVTLETSRKQVAVTRTLTLRAQSLTEEAMGLEVVDAASCARGEELYADLHAVEKAIEADYLTSCTNAYRTWKGLTDERAAELKPVQTAKKRLSPIVATWKVEQAAREEAEKRGRAAAAREQQLEDANRAARKALGTGDVATAASIINEAKTAPAPFVPAGPTTVVDTGLTGLRLPHKAVILDLPTLLRAIAGPVDGERTITEFDQVIIDALQPKLDRLAGTLEVKLADRYPGTEARIVPGLTAR